MADDFGRSTSQAPLLRTPDRGALDATKSSTALQVLKSLPPEAILKVLDIAGDVVRSRLSLEQKHADFLHEIELMRETAGNRDRVLTLVSTLLLSAEINDDAKMKLVETICQLALR